MLKDRVAGAGAARNHPFWLEPEPFLWSGSYSYSDSYSYSTVIILFLRDPKYDAYDYDDYEYDDTDG